MYKNHSTQSSSKNATDKQFLCEELKTIPAEEESKSLADTFMTLYCEDAIEKGSRKEILASITDFKRDVIINVSEYVMKALIRFYCTVSVWYTEILCCFSVKCAFFYAELREKSNYSKFVHEIYLNSHFAEIRN
ncbi:hypothetical protein U3516DRAFT_738881 [Neocallimastix sp. 'constans']